MELNHFFNFVISNLMTTQLHYNYSKKKKKKKKYVGLCLNYQTCVRVDLNLILFAHGTPSYDDIEWELELVALRRAMGLESPSLLGLCHFKTKFSGGSGGACY